jgi:hypothetical protein
VVLVKDGNRLDLEIIIVPADKFPVDMLLLLLLLLLFTSRREYCVSGLRYRNNRDNNDNEIICKATTVQYGFFVCSTIDP